MRSRKKKWSAIGALLLILVMILGSVLRNLDESQRRSLELRDNLDAADSALIYAVITTVNPTAKELTATITLQLKGNIAEDRVTPKQELKLFVNSIRGTQEFDFPRGKRIDQIEATFYMQGEINRYPLDRYESTLWLLVDAPEKSNLSTPASEIPSMHQTQTSEYGQLPTTEAAARVTVVPVSIAVTASIPGMKFDGTASRPNDSKFARVDLRMRRPDNVISVSLVVMLIMMGLALSVLAMVVRAIVSDTSIDLLPLSLSISLIFGLPALRNVQPSVPPVGVLGDYLSFVWAELTVAASAIIAIWTWLTRSYREQK